MAEIGTTPSPGRLDSWEVVIYHNCDNGFCAYEPGDQLVEVFSHVRHLPGAPSAEDHAEWAFHIGNADIDGNRATPAGEADLLALCLYRLLGLRALSVGDVVAVVARGDTTWLACARSGWDRIDAPAVVSRRALSEVVNDRAWQCRNV